MRFKGSQFAVLLVAASVFGCGEDDAAASASRHQSKVAVAMSQYDGPVQVMQGRAKPDVPVRVAKGP